MLSFHNWGSLYHFQQYSKNDIPQINLNQYFETRFLTYKITRIGWIKRRTWLHLDNLVVINHTPNHYIEAINKSIKLNQNIICYTANVIYKSTLDMSSIKVPIKQYIGSTRNTRISRATATNNDIRNGTLGNGMANFCVHYCNQNKFNREDILTYITYEAIEVVKYTSYPVLDEQLLFQAERKHILLNQTFLHDDSNLDSIGLNSWDDVEQPSGMRKIAPAKVKSTAYVLSRPNTDDKKRNQALLQLVQIRNQRMETIKPVYKCFDKMKKVYENLGIVLTDTRKM